MSEILELGLRLCKFIGLLGYYVFDGLFNTRTMGIISPSEKFSTLIASDYVEKQNPSYSPYIKTCMPVNSTFKIATDYLCRILFVNREVPLLLVTPCSDKVAEKTKNLASKTQEEFSGELEVVFLSTGEVTAGIPSMEAYQQKQRAEVKKQMIEDQK